MKRALLATAASFGAAAFLAPAASAQVYGGVGYSAFQADVNGEDVTVGAIMAVGAVLDRIADRRRTFVLDCSAVPHIDSTAAAVIEGAVRGMLPKNVLGEQQLRKLKVYVGSDHPHAQQKPESLPL